MVCCQPLNEALCSQRSQGLKYIILDQEEFSTGSETTILIACSEASQYSSISVPSATAKTYLPVILNLKFKNLNTTYLSKLQGSVALVINMEEYCNAAIPNNTLVMVLSDTWDIQDYVFEHAHKLYRYIWKTTT